MSSQTSLDFNGITSCLIVPQSDTINFGHRDFTIEWWQYETDNNSYVRPFQVGSFSDHNIQLGVSFEGSFILWTANQNPNYLFSMQDYKNKWVHFAICRNSSQIQVFMDGVPKLTTPLADVSTYDFTEDLAIGAETNQADSGSFFGGQIYAFTWIAGEAKYTEPFTPSLDPPIVDGNTHLMLVGSGVDADFTPYTTYGSNGPSISNTDVTANENIPVPPTPPYLTNKYNTTDPIQKRKQNAIKTVQQNYIDNRIYNKNRYAGTNDGYNAAQSLTRLRNVGATVPQKTQHSPFFAVRLFTPTGYVLGGGYRATPPPTDDNTG